jgi:hypothetical protein
MSSVLRAIWENTYGLLVDDGQLALGAVIALAITLVVAQTSGDAVQENAGWLLYAMVLALAVANIYRAGHNARRKSTDPTPR